MSNIKLDLMTMLGFKIIANDQSPAKLQSPKIGDKGGVSDDDAPLARKSPIAAKIGFKTR